jgi:putative PEP-CTERM system histidine kinase
MIFSLISYGAAALAYALLAALLAFSSQAVGRGRWLLIAAGSTSVWGFLVVVILMFSKTAVPPAAYSADAVRVLLWTLCLLSALPDTGWKGTRRVLISAAAATAALAAMIPLLGGAQGPLILLGSSVIACLATEQVFRNSTEEQKRAQRPFVWTVAAVLGYDLFVFSDAVLVQQIDAALWSARGLIAAAAVPFFLVSAKRHPDWARSLFVSRHVVFYSTTLTGVGLYFIAMAVAGTWIRQQGGPWGGVVQFAFFVAALAVLALVLSSARLRIVSRVFITKHFYRNQYEYRDEWLRLIRTLSASNQELPIEQRGIKALADIVDSRGGQIWLNKGKGRYEPFAAWRTPFPSTEYSGTSALVRFLYQQGWIIDSAEYDRDPERYNHAFREQPAELPPDSIIVPLFHQEELLAFARLIRPEQHRALNYEDHDLLKTAGRQVAAFLAHDLATEQLAETRQFDAYYKLSAFVMHDLKNLLSQQALLVENAKKYQHRPEFVADVVKTVDNGVQRMRRLLRQLERDASASHEQRIELSALVEDTVAGCARNGGVIPSFKGHKGVWVHAQPDRLASVIGHVISNAQEATKAGQQISVSVGERAGRALIEVRDTGQGMSEEFIRRRLFKPFDTTKGTSGMGIGAYQAREVIRSLGGEFLVESTLGAGTTVSILLPILPVPANDAPLANGRT